MSDVTRILSRIEEGDPSAAEQLLPLVYDELRKLAANRMAQERLDHTLQSTALVHEAYVRLLDRETVERWNSRGHGAWETLHRPQRRTTPASRRTDPRTATAPWTPVGYW